MFVGMKSLFFYGTFALAVVSSLISCDAHDYHEQPVDTSMHIGDIVCTDGSVVRLEDFKSQNKTADAVVFFVSDGSTQYQGTGYAVCLEDVEAVAFSDSLGVKQGTSASLTDYDGNTNTYELYNNNHIVSPMANAVAEFMTYGQSAYIPSVAQMKFLQTNKAVVNEYLQACGGSTIPDEPDDCWYWTSTEVEGQEEMKAWLYSVASGAQLETSKIQKHRVRPIITVWQ